MFSSGNCASVPLVASLNGNGNGGGNGGNGNGLFDNGAWIIIILFLFVFLGWGNNWGGNGNNGGNGGGGTMPTYIPIPTNVGGSCDSDVQRGFNQQAVITKLDGITQGICDSTYALNNTVTNGFAGVNQSLCQGFNGVNTAMLQGFNGVERGFCNLGSQLQQCCCENREAIAQVRYDMATQACDTRNTIQNTTRDIIENQNAGVRSILDFLTQDKIATLTAENQSLKFQASQTAQNAFIAANQTAQTAELIRRLGADCPVNAYVVQPPTPVTFPTNCCGQFNGYNNYNNGCGGCNSGC